MNKLISNDTNNTLLFYPGDGLLDIFIGLGILFAGLFLWTGLVWMVAIFIPTLLPSFQAARRNFLENRIGIQALDSHRQVPAQKLQLAMTMMFVVLLLVGIGMLFAFGFMSGSLNEWLRQYFLLAFGLIVAGVWLFAGAVLKLKRFYLYALFTFAALTTAQYTVLPFWLAMALLGGVITCVGLLVLIRFLQQHPIIR